MLQHRSASILVAVLAVCASAACAGQQSPYRAYRELHPDWSARELEAGMGSDEALAIAYAPAGRGTSTSVKLLGAYALVSDAWLEQPLQDAPTVPASGEGLVVTRTRCTDRFSEIRVDVIGYYHFLDGSLHGFLHWTFGRFCAGKQTILPSRTRASFDHLLPDEL